MSSLNIFVLSVVASLFLAAAAHAGIARQCAVTPTTKVVYQAKDSRGRRLFLLTVTDPSVVTLSRIPRATIHDPRLNWTALIGTGHAAVAEQRR